MSLAARFDADECHPLGLSRLGGQPKAADVGKNYLAGDRFNGLPLQLVVGTWWTEVLLIDASGCDKPSGSPHRFERYMQSDDPDFESKVADVIGLYINPPDHAAVLAVDDKRPFRRSTASIQCCRRAGPNGVKGRKWSEVDFEFVRQRNAMFESAASARVPIPSLDPAAPTTVNAAAPGDSDEGKHIE